MTEEQVKEIKQALGDITRIESVSVWMERCRQLLVEREALKSENGHLKASEVFKTCLAQEELLNDLKAECERLRDKLQQIDGQRIDTERENERMRNVLNQIKYMPSTPPIIRKLADRSLSPQEGER